MGILRIFFALLICIAHAKHYGLLPEELLPGVVGLPLDPKIDIFFMLAGFFSRQTLLQYQAQGERRRARRFYLTRCARLWPAYWFCLALTWLIVHALHQSDYPPRLDQPLPQLAWWQFWPQNLLPFLPASLKVTKLLYPWDTVVDRLVVFQAWTLALLTVLFALAPFMMAGRRLYALFFLSLAGIAYDVSHYDRFNGYVLTALPYYLAGAIAYDIYRRLSLKLPQPSPASLALVVTLLLGVGVMLVLYDGMYAAFGGQGAHTLVTLCAFPLLPFLYQATRKSALDRYIGNLSYPLYLSQFLTFYLLSPLLGLSGAALYYAVIPACLLVAAAIHHLVERPAWRLWREENRPKKTSPGLASRAMLGMR